MSGKWSAGREMFPYNKENIVAIATPPGIGALAVVRISGGNLKQLYKDLHYLKDIYISSYKS